MADTKLALDDMSSSEADASPSPSPAAVPKKRGRPGSAIKAGRGRPKLDRNDDDAENGEAAENGNVKRGPGRPPKGTLKKKIHTIAGTGKGRGRPKKVVEEDANASDASDDAEVVPSKKAKKTPVKGVRGRPKKVKNSDDESKY